MFTYTSIILRMFQIEMPLVLAPHEDYYVPPSINLRSRQTLNIHITAIPQDIGHLHLTFLICIILGQKAISSRIIESTNDLQPLTDSIHQSVVVRILEPRSSAGTYACNDNFTSQYLYIDKDRRAMNPTHFLYSDNIEYVLYSGMFCNVLVLYLNILITKLSLSSSHQ